MGKRKRLKSVTGIGHSLQASSEPALEIPKGTSASFNFQASAL